MDVNHNTLAKLIHKSYYTTIPLFVKGTTGIGKSHTIREQAKIIAAKEDRELVDWNYLSKEEHIALATEPDKLKKLFILADVRISQMDPGDLRGLPFMVTHDMDVANNSKISDKRFARYVEWSPMALFQCMSQHECKGLLFFDEMNLASPAVQAAAYQIILDRCIGEISLSPGVSVLAAGNRVEDRANVFEMAAPLKNRFSHINLTPPTIKEWTDFAIKADVDSRIITFLQFKPSLLMADLSKLAKSKTDAFPTPRSWVYCSKLIRDEKGMDFVHTLAATAIGDGPALEFKAYVKLNDTLDINDLLNHPEKVKKIGALDLKWSFVSAVSEMYRADKKLLTKVIEVCPHMDPDFSVNLLRMMKAHNKTSFVTALTKSPECIKIVKRYAKYLV